nr:unnamed protein product [Callosobruchus chinensis]
MYIRNSGLVYFDKALKNPKIVLDNHDYRIYRKEFNKTIWKCYQYFGSKKDRCRSTLVTTGAVIHVSKDPHNHPVINTPERLRNMMSKLVTIIRQT